jgi:hypothetical protein
VPSAGNDCCPFAPNGVGATGPNAGPAACPTRAYHSPTSGAEIITVTAESGCLLVAVLPRITSLVPRREHVARSSPGPRSPVACSRLDLRNPLAGVARSPFRAFSPGRGSLRVHLGSLHLRVPRCDVRVSLAHWVDGRSQVGPALAQGAFACLCLANPHLPDAGPRHSHDARTLGADAGYVVHRVANRARLGWSPRALVPGRCRFIRA